MIAYVKAITKSADACIDAIVLRKSNGDETILTWDESMVSRTDYGFEARYKGVYFDEVYANGKPEEVENATLSDVICYTDSLEDDSEVRIFSLEIIDESSVLQIMTREEKIKAILNISEEEMQAVGDCKDFYNATIEIISVLIEEEFMSIEEFEDYPNEDFTEFMEKYPCVTFHGYVRFNDELDVVIQGLGYRGDVPQKMGIDFVERFRHADEFDYESDCLYCFYE